MKLSVSRRALRVTLLPGLFLVFVCFPFTKILPLETYNQPYALLLAMLIVVLFPNCIQKLPKIDQLALSYLVLLGFLLFVISATGAIQFREISYLLSYLTPAFVTVACFWVFTSYPDMARKIISVSLVIWLFVSTVQTLGNSNFMTSLVAHNDELGSNIALSGRGALGMAPEPTHNGFHLLILAATLYVLNGSFRLVVLAVLGALVLAKSSSAMLALVVGVVLWALVRPLARIWIFGAILGALTFSSILPLIFDDSYRITRIILAIYESGGAIFLFDYSINARLSGMFAPLYLFVERAMMPLGMSLESWLDVRQQMLFEFPWMVSLSEGGPASGIGMILLHAGIFGVPLVVYIIWRLVFSLGSLRVGLLTASCFFVFMGQLYLATPTFGLILAAVIARAESRRQEQAHPIGVAVPG